MGTARFRLAHGVVVEEIGNDLMVMIDGSTETLSLSGAAADAVRKTQAGQPVTVDSVSDDLIRAGVLETSNVSRRGLIKASAIGAGAGITILSMPGVAAASSHDHTGGGAGSGSTNGTGSVPGGEADGYQPPANTPILDSRNEWSRRTDIDDSESIPSGTNYYFGFFLNTRFADPQTRPTLRFKGFDDEVPALDENSFNTAWKNWAEFFPLISSLSTGLQEFLDDSEGPIPALGDGTPPTLLNDFLFVEWGDTTYGVHDIEWY